MHANTMYRCAQDIYVCVLRYRCIVLMYLFVFYDLLCLFVCKVRVRFCADTNIHLSHQENLGIETRCRTGAAGT